MGALRGAASGDTSFEAETFNILGKRNREKERKKYEEREEEKRGRGICYGNATKY